MSRNLMPKSGAMAPYVVVNRDAAVAGVFSVDGEKGAIILTDKYVQITTYNQKIGTLEASIETINGNIITINESIKSLNDAVGALTNTTTNLSNNKAAKGANNDITELNGLTKAITIAQGGTGATTVDGAKTAFGLDRFTQIASGTYMYSPDKKMAFTVLNDGTWGLYRANSNDRIALPITAGGTGALTAAEARANLDVLGVGDYGLGGSVNGIPRVANLSEIKGSGIYTLFGDGTTTPTVGTPPGSGNAIVFCIVTPIYSNAWAINATVTNGRTWTGVYDPTKGTATWTDGAGYFSYLMTTGAQDAVQIQAPSGAPYVHYCYKNSAGTVKWRTSFNTTTGYYEWFTYNDDGSFARSPLKLGPLGDLATTHSIYSAGPIFIEAKTQNNPALYFRSGSSQLYSIDFVDASTRARSFQVNTNATTVGYIYKMATNGTFTAGAVSQTSDKRAKYNTKTIENALEKLLSLEGVTYSMRVSPGTEVVSAGVYAQDVQKVLPEAIMEGTAYDKDGEEIPDALALNYSALSSLYVEAIKELNSLVQEQRSEIDELKAIVAQLMPK